MNIFPVKKSADFVFFWKPAGIPTTFGNKKCFLEEISKSCLDESLREFGLLNRLDNNTSGLLFFARNQSVFEKYKQKQKDGKIVKTYFATVYGEISQSFFYVKTPIGHHKDDIQKMTVCADLMRGKHQFAETYFEFISYNKEKNLTELKVEIKKGVRHQIRCHISSFGHPILNDSIYCNKNFRKKFDLNLKEFQTELGLVSVGLKIS